MHGEERPRKGELPGAGSAGSWQHLALEIVERAAEARQRARLLGDLFALLERRIGFDSGSVATASGDLFGWRKPEACRQAWTERCPAYLRELAPCLRLAAASGDVAQDVDAMSGRERGRASFYTEYMRPLGARSYAFVLVRSSQGLLSALSLSRPEPGGFAARELELLRQLRPALALALRSLPEGSRGAAASDAGQRPRARLTPREVEIAAYVARGLRNAEVAALCGCSPNTVRNQLVTIFRKLDVSTRAELAMRIASEGGG